MGFAAFPRRFFPLATSGSTRAILRRFASHATPLLFLLCVVASPLSVGGAYSRPSCEFHSANYSLEWAFEPSSQSVVFVLRAALPHEPSGDTAATPSTKATWTGVGFGDRSKDTFIDFIGVFVDRGQTGITDAHIDVNAPDGGGGDSPKLRADLNTNVQTISVELDKNQGGWVKATFARTAAVRDRSNKQDHELKLEGCNLFNLPLRMYTEQSGSGDVLKSLKQLKVCDIAKQCSVRLEDLKLNGLDNKAAERNEYKIVFADNQLRREQVNKDAPKQLGNVAHSVDVSGTGDPCSFTGTHYSLNWTYSDVDDSVHFTMLQPVKRGKWWSAVGIGEWMANMDIGVIFLEDGKVKQINDYFSTGYDVPAKDSQQDWKEGASRIVKVKKDGGKSEDRVELKFSRKITTSDKDKDHSMEGCVLFQFAANGGRYGAGYAIRKHDDWPDLYKACDLKKRCTVGGAAASTDSKPTTLFPRGSTKLNLTAGDDGEAVKLSARELNDTITANLTASDVPLAASNGTSTSGRVATVEKGKKAGGEELPGVVESTVSNNTIQMRKRQENETVQADPVATTTEPPTPSNDTQIAVTNPPTASGDAAPENPRLEDPESIKSTTILQLFGEFPNNTSNVTANANPAGGSSPTGASPAPSYTATRPTGQPPTLPINPSAAGEERESKTTVPVALTEGPTSTARGESTPESQPANTTTADVVGVASKGADENIKAAQPTMTTPTAEAQPTTQTSAQTSPPPSIAPPESQPPPAGLNDTGTTVGLEASSTATSTVITESSPTVATTTESLTTTPAPITTTPIPIKLEPKIIEVKQHNTTQSVNESPRGANPNVANQASSSRPATGLIDACSALNPDLKVCHSYMSNYFEQVQRWADKHNELLEAQLGKACSLLGAVPHVPTLCCQIFHQKCAGHL